MSRGAITAIDPRHADHVANRAAMLELLEQVTEAQTQVLDGGGERYVARHRERGRLLVRERVDLLLDRRLAVPRAAHPSPAGAPTTRSVAAW